MVNIFLWDNYPKMELYLSELYDKYGANYYQIQEEMNKKFNRNFSYDSLRNRIRRSPIINYIPNKRGQGIFKDLDDNKIYNDYIEAKYKIKETMEYFDKKYGNKEIDILTISDLHIPKENLDILEKIILKNQDCDILVIAGDILDFDNLSRFGHKKNIDVSSEYKRAFEILKRITPLFDDVFISSGNHEARWTNYIKHKNVTSLSSFLLDRFKPLEPVVKYFENITYIPHWFFQLGEVIFAHPFRYSKIVGRTARNVVEDRIEKKHEKEFGKFSTVICAHTHRIFKGQFSGRIAAENGCIQQKGAEFNNRDAKGKNWHYGYTRIKMKNGKTDWNNVDVQSVE